MSDSQLYAKVIFVFAALLALAGLKLLGFETAPAVTEVDTSLPSSLGRISGRLAHPEGHDWGGTTRVQLFRITRQGDPSSGPAVSLTVGSDVEATGTGVIYEAEHRLQTDAGSFVVDVEPGDFQIQCETRLSGKTIGGGVSFLTIAAGEELFPIIRMGGGTTLSGRVESAPEHDLAVEGLTVQVSFVGGHSIEEAVPDVEVLTDSSGFWRAEFASGLRLDELFVVRVLLTRTQRQTLSVTPARQEGRLGEEFRALLTPK